MHKTVSIIIPVYNSEKHLPECLGNIVNQTLSGIEVILVNDASTDGSLEIMNECRAQFPDLVKVIDSKENMGAGGARNLGIAAAAGAYIGFVDSDDLIEPSMFQKLYEKAQEGGFDFVDCGYYNQADDLAIIHTSDEMAGYLDDEKRKQFIVSGGYIVTKLFRRELFYDQQLRFRCNVILEDADFLVYLYATAVTAGNVKEVLYYYRNQQESSSKVLQTDKYFYNICEAMKAIYEKASKLDNYGVLRQAVEYEIIQMYSYGVNICLKAYLKGENVDCRGMLMQIRGLKSNIVSEGYTNLYVRNKISNQDIVIMQMNDDEPEKLLKICKNL